jgi:aspartyl-tRNA synthetase
MKFEHISHHAVENHLNTIPAEWFKNDWQQIQYIDAVRILLNDVYNLPWAVDFPWTEYAAKTRTIDARHHTLARETLNNFEVSPEVSQDLSPEQTDSLQQLSRSLRENRYAI